MLLFLFLFLFSVRSGALCLCMNFFFYFSGGWEMDRNGKMEFRGPPHGVKVVRFGDDMGRQTDRQARVHPGPGRLNGIIINASKMA